MIVTALKWADHCPQWLQQTIVCARQSNPSKLCLSVTPRDEPLILQSKPSIIFWSSLWKWLPDDRQGLKISNLDANLNSDQWVLKVLSALKSPNNLWCLNSFRSDEKAKIEAAISWYQPSFARLKFTVQSPYLIWIVHLQNMLKHFITFYQDSLRQTWILGSLWVETETQCDQNNINEKRPGKRQECKQHKITGILLLQLPKLELVSQNVADFMTM